MPEKFTVDLSPVPDLDLGSKRERGQGKQPTKHGRGRESTVAHRGKPAAAPKRYAFRRS